MDASYDFRCAVRWPALFKKTQVYFTVQNLPVSFVFLFDCILFDGCITNEVKALLIVFGLYAYFLNLKTLKYF